MIGGWATNCEPSVSAHSGNTRGESTPFGVPTSSAEFVPWSATQRPPPSTQARIVCCASTLGRTLQV